MAKQILQKKYAEELKEKAFKDGEIDPINEEK
jgi:hypothetical protein